jgi:hypothetical protein
MRMNQILGNTRIQVLLVQVSVVTVHISQRRSEDQRMTTKVVTLSVDAVKKDI